MPNPDVSKSLTRCAGSGDVLPDIHLMAPSHQQLQLIRKIGGQRAVTVLEGCRFVPLITANQQPNPRQV